jgi:hypothetical protein
MATLQYVQPTDEQKALMQEFRDKLEVIFIDIKNNIPDGRGKSIALTKLEESAMWINKRITNND